MRPRTPRRRRLTLALRREPETTRKPLARDPLTPSGPRPPYVVEHDERVYLD